MNSRYDYRRRGAWDNEPVGVKRPDGRSEVAQNMRLRNAHLGMDRNTVLSGQDVLTGERSTASPAVTHAFPGRSNMTTGTPVSKDMQGLQNQIPVTWDDRQQANNAAIAAARMRQSGQAPQVAGKAAATAGMVAANAVAPFPIPNLTGSPTGGNGGNGAAAVSPGQTAGVRPVAAPVAINPQNDNTQVTPYGILSPTRYGATGADGTPGTARINPSLGNYAFQPQAGTPAGVLAKTSPATQPNPNSLFGPPVAGVQSQGDPSSLFTVKPPVASIDQPAGAQPGGVQPVAPPPQVAYQEPTKPDAKSLFGPPVTGPTAPAAGSVAANVNDDWKRKRAGTADYLGN